MIDQITELASTTKTLPSNIKYLPYAKYITLVFGFLSLIVNTYNIVMVIVYGQVYFMGNPLYEVEVPSINNMWDSLVTTPTTQPPSQQSQAFETYMLKLLI